MKLLVEVSYTYFELLSISTIMKDKKNKTNMVYFPVWINHIFSRTSAIITRMNLLLLSVTIKGDITKPHKNGAHSVCLNTCICKINKIRDVDLMISGSKVKLQRFMIWGRRNSTHRIIGLGLDLSYRIRYLFCLYLKCLLVACFVNVFHVDTNDQTKPKGSVGSPQCEVTNAGKWCLL